MTKLTIKAANGSVDDFTVEAELSWSVKKLKNHLYRHYPTHPPISCQKIIYGGKLLLDQMTLSEARIPSANEPVVIHLVVFERSTSAPTPMVNAITHSGRVHTGAHLPRMEGVRGSQPVTPVQETVHEDRVDRASSPDQPSQRLSPTMNNPWLRHRGGRGVVMNPAEFPMFGAGVGPTGGYPTFPAIPRFYQSPYNAAYLQQWYYNQYYRVPGTGVMGDEGEVREEQNPLDLPPLNPDDPNDLPEPEDEEDIPVNAPGGLGLMAGGGGLRHRDLVDYLYMFMMMAFLVLVAYLTGSLGRLLIFAAGVMFMLLNQGGFFSLQRRRYHVEPNPPPNPPPHDPQVDQSEGRAEGSAEQEAVDGNEVPASRPEESQHHSDEPLPPPPPDPVVEQRPGIVATVLIFVTSFFTSLVPQQRPDLQVN